MIAACPGASALTWSDFSRRREAATTTGAANRPPRGRVTTSSCHPRGPVRCQATVTRPAASDAAETPQVWYVRRTLLASRSNVRTGPNRRPDDSSSAKRSTLRPRKCAVQNAVTRPLSRPSARSSGMSTREHPRLDDLGGHRAGERGRPRAHAGDETHDEQPAAPSHKMSLTDHPSAVKRRIPERQLPI